MEAEFNFTAAAIKSLLTTILEDNNNDKILKRTAITMLRPVKFLEDCNNFYNEAYRGKIVNVSKKILRKVELLNPNSIYTLAPISFYYASDCVHILTFKQIKKGDQLVIQPFIILVYQDILSNDGICVYKMFHNPTVGKNISFLQLLNNNLQFAYELTRIYDWDLILNSIFD